ncbi:MULTISPECIES: transcriptional regulator [unclassified Microbulbifer]|uniref:Transcriptional regulator n=1 Tax=Microbulbifer spongiae TaxID=2944933 RepID=A0ABY9EDN2_9GAMM|nr:MULTISPECIES: transcriptional regulator [unclassified Microbulbifer]MDP5210128.1 transcriptional regulator [Microbulbifer sp. 2205BS26-8]WKD49634.1 transcriptional regulator [Microbulbifer sp. MI-G]
MKALGDLNPALEHRIRLAICVLLAKHGEISFSRFKQQLAATDGNLGAQLRRLEEQGFIDLRKDLLERKPVTWYRLTTEGRKALEQHLEALQQLISAMD